MKLLSPPLWLLCAAFVAPSAMGATACPLIRPPGLSAQQVDAIVVGQFAAWLRIPVAAIDTSKTVKALDSSDNAALDFLMAALGISQTLGSDVGKLSYEAAVAKGAKDPVGAMTIADIQTIARKVYAQGHDEPPPVADPRIDYAVTRLPVHAPSLPSGEWRMTHCGADDVTFVHAAASGRGDVLAALRDASLPRYTSDAALVHDVADILRAQLPPGLTPTGSMQSEIVKGTRAPCGDASVLVDDATLGASVSFAARVCYMAADNPNVWIILFSQRLPLGQKPDPVAAAAFITATSPKY